jgi:LPXTG-site transpeptidase (sortase) family protein
LGPSDLRLGDAAFQFLEPPQPGATVLLSLSVHNPTDAASDRISLDLPRAWLAGYRIEGVVPLPSDGTLDGQQVNNALRLTFDGPPAGEDLPVGVWLVTTAEVIDAPDLRVVDEQGRLVGTAKPPTEAPPAEPGPVYAIDIPRLKLHAGVVQVEWEPPLFVVGQLKSSAYITEGNSVLVGHVRGAAGYNVFDHLDQLSVGDEIVANSRGETYQFVVSETHVLPKDDTSPTLPTDDARLTLMTCAGEWDPITRDYSERLWIVAEPAETVAARAAGETGARLAAGATRATGALGAAGPAGATPARPPVQVSPRGGLGNTDSDLAAGYGGPVGQSAAGLAVYRRAGAEHQAALLEAGAQVRRAAVVVDRLAAPLSLEAAARESRGLLPKDTQPRSAGPEGNARFVVERFSSPALAEAVPAEWFQTRGAQPGEFIVVYAKAADGRITDIVAGVGNDPSGLLDLLKPR